MDLTIASVRIALSIAGSDPTGGAGLQADLQVFRALGVHGMGVVTALTIQDTAKVHQVLPVFPSAVLEQIRVLARDVHPDAVKLGMLATDDVARMVEFGLAEMRSDPSLPLVIDPVLDASDGSPLLERRALGTLTRLIESASLVTPNLPEAERLTGRDLSTREGVEAAARTLVSEMGAHAALITGGHDPDRADDLLAIRQTGGETRLRWLEGERIEAGPVHGTGCALAAAATAGLASGRGLEEAVVEARAFVAAGLRLAQAVGQGARLLGFS